MLLAVFLAMSAYGHRYDVLLQRRSSMRGSLIALHVLSKMIKRNRSKNKIQEVDVEKLMVHQESNTQPGQVANEETLARRKVALDHFMGKDKKDLEPAKSLLWGFETLPSAQRILKEVYENVDGDSNDIDTTQTGNSDHSITAVITGSTNNIDIDQLNSTGSVSDVVVITATTSNGTIDIDQCTSGC